MLGTVRKNRRFIPPIMLDMKKKPLFHSEYVFDNNLRGTMVSYKAKRNKFVTLLSTFHTSKQTEFPDVDKKPEIIKMYNKTKGGVDTLDQLVGTYRCKRKVKRWPVAFYANMMDISAWNAFVLFVMLNPTWNGF